MIKSNIDSLKSNIDSSKSNIDKNINNLLNAESREYVPLYKVADQFANLSSDKLDQVVTKINLFFSKSEDVKNKKGDFGNTLNKILNT